MDRIEAAQGGEGATLIGQFGVGFYSAFMVADRVDVLSRRAGTDEAWQWSSDGKGTFSVSPAPLESAPGRGTRVGDSDAILNGRVDPVRKRRSRLRAAGGALAIMRTMFGDDERLRLGQIKHLTGAMADTRVRPKARTAHRAGRRVMIDNVVRIP